MQLYFLAACIITPSAQSAQEPDPIQIYFDGLHATPVRLNAMSGSPITAMLRYRYATSQGIVANATHVKIPIGQVVQGDIIMKPKNSLEEFGVDNQVFYPNLPSHMGAPPVVGAAEKMFFQRQHASTPAYGEKGRNAESEREREHGQLGDNDQRTNSTARHLKARLGYEYLVTSRLGPDLIIASSSPDVIQGIQKLSGLPPKDDLVDISNHLRQQFPAAPGVRSSGDVPTPVPDVSHSKQCCFHLADKAGDFVKVEPDGFYIPRNVVGHAMRACISSYPHDVLTYTEGVMFADYDADADEVFITFAGLSHSHFNVSVQSGVVDAVFDVGSLQDVNIDRRQARRVQPPRPPTQSYELFNRWNAIPTDTKHMYSKSLCTPGSAVHKSASLDIGTYDWSKFTISGFADILARHDDCFAAYTRGPVAGFHGLGMLQMITVAHMSSEIAPSYFQEFLTIPWNDLNMLAARQQCPFSVNDTLLITRDFTSISGETVRSGTRITIFGAYLRKFLSTTNEGRYFVLDLYDCANAKKIGTAQSHSGAVQETSASAALIPGVGFIAASILMALG